LTNAPKDVERIGTNAFGSCNKLTEINVDINNTNSTTIDGVLYDNNHSRLLQHPCGNNDSIYDIVDGMRTVGPHAFDGCRSLTTVNIPDSVQSIDSFAFYECVNLTSKARSLWRVNFPKTFVFCFVLFCFIFFLNYLRQETRGWNEGSEGFLVADESGSAWRNHALSTN